MLTDDLKKAGEELQAHRDRLRSLSNILRFGVLVDAQHIAANIAAEIHTTARLLEISTNQLELLPVREKGDKP